MKKQLAILAAGLAAAAGLSGQQQFQQADTMGRGVVRIPLEFAGGRGAVVTGSPFSAKEVRKTVQTLSDGTQLENSTTTLFYRDSLGRTRTESQEGKGSITIIDPVAGFRYQLNPAEKGAMRIAMPGGGGRAGGRAMAPPAADLVKTAQALDQVKIAVQSLDQVKPAGQPITVEEKLAIANRTKPHEEDLGFQNQNGVMAQGTRSTVVIPQGQIGNNRDIHVVNERWYSKDLQMMVKTVNSDPRFGVTTYEVTDIVQTDPDATLFQVPAGYTVTEGGGRGGRAGAGR